MIPLIKAFALTGGEWVIYLLLICSVIAVAVMIERGIVLSRERKELKKIKEIFYGSIETNVLEKWSGQIAGLSGVSAQVLSAGVRSSAKGADFAEQAMASVALQERRRLELRMIVLGTLGNNAIYIGLFGTVLGVIKAFRDLAEGGGAGPEIVMQGLSEALIATAVGLLVALPCVMTYNLFQKQIKDLLSETESMSRLLLARFKSK